MKTITTPLDDNLHTKFKKFCIDRKLTMIEAITIAIKILIKQKKVKKV